MLQGAKSWSWYAVFGIAAVVISAGVAAYRRFSHTWTLLIQVVLTHTHNRLTAFCRDNPGRLVPEETFTHSHPSWSSDILYKLPPFKYDPYHPPHSVYVLDSPFRQPLSRSSLVLDPLLHTPCISSPSHHLLFAAHAHTITAYFSVIPMLSVPNLSLSAPYLEICLSLMPHIHVTIVITSCWSATSLSLLTVQISLFKCVWVGACIDWYIPGLHWIYFF